MMLMLALVEGFIDRGFGAPCAVYGSHGPGLAIVGAVLFAVMWVIAIPVPG